MRDGSDLRAVSHESGREERSELDRVDRAAPPSFPLYRARWKKTRSEDERRNKRVGKMFSGESEIKI